jgi:hypothetical protein
MAQHLWCSIASAARVCQQHSRDLAVPYARCLDFLPTE